MPDPSGIFDLPTWKLTLPVGAKGKPTELAGSDLRTYESDWCRRVGDAIQFRAAVNGVTTSGSGYPRSELRELDGKGGLASWATTSGFHRMSWVEAFTHLPNDKPHTVGAQIHNADNDLTVFRLEGSTLYVTNGDDTHYAVADAHYVLGTQYRGRFEVSGGGVIQAFYNDKLVATVKAKSSGCYFKIGDYTQANASNSSPADASNYGETVVYNVTVQHSTSPLPDPMPVPPVDPGPVNPPPPPPTSTGGPTTVLVIRHAEKPVGKLKGVKPAGSSDSHSLTTVGWSRAGALVGFFTSGRVPLPGTIVASGGKGLRPVQTVTQLAAKLGLTPVTTWDIEVDYAKAGAGVKAMSGVVAVCLEHTALGQFCAAAGLPTPPVPPDDRYDWCLVFSRDPVVGWQLSQVPQLLLAGDSFNPI